jgi:hypothetical protein
VNKVVAILGIIVLITLGGLFFCAGFFTGTTTLSTITASSDKSTKDVTADGISLERVEAAIDTKSASMSDKIMEILASTTETASSTISNVANHGKMLTGDNSTHVSVDSLLREIAAGHSTNDNCSPNDTLQKINTPHPVNPNSLHGKRVVFVGYFKNKIALEIQKLLITKGYKAHLETSKTGDGESFVFCGPFKKEKNAQMLVKWLRKHDFSEARMVKISEVAIEETLYDALNDSAGPPENAEKDIPETLLPPLTYASPPVPTAQFPGTATQIPPPPIVPMHQTTPTLPVTPAYPAM